MSFLTDLAKGFVRSAVNQVGRDGGKVISNKLYGDNHSTPIRNISTQNGIYYDELTSAPISKEELREKIASDGFKKSYSISNMGILLKTWGYILGIICSAILYAIYPYLIALPFLIFILFIIMKYRFKSISVYKYQDVGVYREDRRHKSGRRLAGFKRQKESFNIPATENEQRTILYICLFYTILAISMPILGYYLYNLFQ